MNAVLFELYLSEIAFIFALADLLSVVKLPSSPHSPPPLPTLLYHECPVISQVAKGPVYVYRLYIRMSASMFYTCTRTYI